MEPSKKVSMLLKFARILKTSKEVADEMKKFGLHVNDEMVQLQGRTLPPEKVRIGDREFQDRDWTHRKILPQR